MPVPHSSPPVVVESEEQEDALVFFFFPLREPGSRVGFIHRLAHSTLLDDFFYPEECSFFSPLPPRSSGFICPLPNFRGTMKRRRSRECFTEKTLPGREGKVRAVRQPRLIFIEIYSDVNQRWVMPRVNQENGRKYKSRERNVPSSGRRNKRQAEEKGKRGYKSGCKFESI